MQPRDKNSLKWNPFLAILGELHFDSCLKTKSKCEMKRNGSFSPSSSLNFKLLTTEAGCTCDRRGEISKTPGPHCWVVISRNFPLIESRCSQRRLRPRKERNYWEYIFDIARELASKVNPMQIGTALDTPFRVPSDLLNSLLIVSTCLSDSRPVANDPSPILEKPRLIEQ